MTTIAQDLGGVVLLPCPMCGGEAHLERQGHVACTTGWPCVHTAYFNSGTPAEQNAAAITAWNTRVHSAEIAGALRDAERYRWLKCNCQHMPDEIGIAGQLYFGTYAWGDLDTAIDSAMQQGGGGGE